MTQSATETPWSERLALSVAQEVRRHRQRLGVSAQQLSERCAELGMPIQRSVLANMESGRRSTVTVAEVLILAAALDVAGATGVPRRVRRDLRGATESHPRANRRRRLVRGKCAFPRTAALHWGKARLGPASISRPPC
ncbi:helix-turn-helix domain-containing protein [Streptomyces nogalater]